MMMTTTMLMLGQVMYPEAEAVFWSDMKTLRQFATLVQPGQSLVSIVSQREAIPGHPPAVSSERHAQGSLRSWAEIVASPNPTI
jgi:hypothetical protein